MNRIDVFDPIRRILVALDASANSFAALEAAAALAARTNAELLGLFVEDINLLHLAGLPFAREVGYFSALPRKLGNRAIERALHAQAAQAQQALADLAQRMNLHWSFRVVRGVVAAQLLEASVEVDLIALGMVRRRARLSSVTRALMARASRPLLLLREGIGIRPPVLVFYDGSPAAAKALAAAQHLVPESGEGLAVLIAAKDPTAAERLRHEAKGLLGQQVNMARFRYVTPDIAALARVAETEGAGALVLADSKAQSEEALDRLLAEVECAVLLVR